MQIIITIFDVFGVKKITDLYISDFGFLAVLRSVFLFLSDVI